MGNKPSNSQGVYLINNLMLCNKRVSLKKIIENFDTNGYYFDTKIDNIEIFFF